MSLARWNKPLRIFAGALCALVAGWAAVAFGIWLTFIAVDYLDPAPSLFPAPQYLIGFGVLWLVAFPVIGFAMGLICAFWWHELAPIGKQQHWAIGLALTFFLPSAILSFGAICLLIVAVPLMAVALMQGIEKQSRWRHFVGLANDYERENRE